MKRFFLFALLIFATIGLPVTVVHAQTMDPGCSPEMWGYLKDQANATRARNKAYEREILHRQQSTLYLTCFDQAMALSARLGMIFSDDIYPNPPPANTLVFPTPAYPDWGAARPTLAMDLNTVVNPEFDNWLSHPVAPPALFNFLPQWLETTPALLDNKLTPLAIAQQAIIGGIVGFQAGDAAMSAQYNAMVVAINSLVQMLPTMPLESLPPADTQYMVMMTELQTLVAGIETTRGAMNPFISALATVLADFKPNCTRIDDVWDKLDPGYVTTDAGVFYPPEGKYYPFTPYYTLKDFLTNNPPQSPPATPDFVQELSNATDSAALSQALADLQDPLSTVGKTTLWPAPPTFNQKQQEDYTAADVIEQM